MQVMEDLFEPFEEVSAEPEEFLPASGDRIVALVIMRFRPHGTAAFVENRIAHVWTFRDGAVTRMHVFPEREKALEAAGLAGTRPLDRPRLPCEHVFVSGRRPTILHADLDSFYASVEQRDDPRLRGRPVIVGGGVVLAASYEAKAYGVRTAMGGGRRAGCAPGGRGPAADVGLLRGEQGRIRGVPRDHAAGRGAVDRRGVPRRSRDASGSRARPARSPCGCGATCASSVGLPITVGIARTKFLAKVASGVAKPDGLLVVPPGGELEFLHPLPVERLWGVGPVTAAQAP